MTDYFKLYEYQGKCPICDRDMFKAGKSTNQHHFIPKSRGGKEQEWCHTVCHDFLHRTFTNKQLEKEYSDPGLIKADERVQVFINWIKKKDPLFYISTKPNKSKNYK